MNEEIEKGKYEGSSRSDTIIYRSIVGGMLGLAALGAGYTAYKIDKDLSNDAESTEKLLKSMGNALLEEIAEIVEEDLGLKR